MIEGASTRLHHEICSVSFRQRAAKVLRCEANAAMGRNGLGLHNFHDPFRRVHETRG